MTLSKLKDTFTKKGYSIINVYIDEGVSGNSIERPNFYKMLDDLKANQENEIVPVIVSDLSHLARDEQILLTMRDKIVEARGCIANPDQNLHLNIMEANINFWNSLPWHAKLKFWMKKHANLFALNGNWFGLRKKHQHYNIQNRPLHRD
jgi:hypothetical protein